MATKKNEKTESVVKKKDGRKKNEKTESVVKKKDGRKKSKAVSKGTRNHDEPTTKLSQTRLCIKNLPQSLSETGLRDYIHQQTKNFLKETIVVTDCRILKRADGKSRRLAFVGFASAEHASICQEKLNKAYCQTARLMVEFAHLPKQHKYDVDDTKEEEVEKEKDAKEVSSDSKKPVDEKIEKRKQEFLAVMGITESTTKRKFWANDEENPEKQKASTEKEEKNTTVGSDSDSDGDDSSSSSSSSNDEDDDDDDADPLQKDTAAKAAKSDFDFLRSKQVQVMDLDERLDQQPQSSENKNEKGDSLSDSDSDDSSSDSEVEDEVQPMKGVKIDLEAKEDSKTTTKTDDSEGVGLAEMSQNRLFLRNLPFSATEDDLRKHLSSCGPVEECHIPIDDQKRSKGFAFVTFERVADAATAMSRLDGEDFQGRLLHILPARKAPSQDKDIDDDPNLTYKEKMERKRQREAGKETTGWSASYVRGDSVVDNLAMRLGLRKGDILAVKDGLSSGDAAVRLALGETAIIEENRKYFEEHGIDMEALVSFNSKEGAEVAPDKISRSKTSILVKNLPFDTTQEELLKMFSFGTETPSRILLPPSRTLAVVEYGHPNDAKVAFRRLAYRRFKSVPLYLEWAPMSSKIINESKEENAPREEKTTADNLREENAAEDAEEGAITDAISSLYVKNLSFSTSEDQLSEFFSKHFKDVRSVRIPKKVAPAKRVRITGKDTEEENRLLSMGFGFVEFGSAQSVREAIKKLQGAMLDGHALELKPSSNKNSDSSKPKINPEKAPLKLMVRNVPFQASRKELLQLFGSFGQLKNVRLPKKFDGSHRGFAFIEYLTGKEAAAAMKSLSRTHLYGRHLVIEWAAKDEETDNLEELRNKAERDVLPAPKAKKIRFE